MITKADPGQFVTVVGTGFLPFSTATIIAYSSPIVLANVVTDGDGNFTSPVRIPSDLAAGSHNLVAAGVDPAGATRQLRLPFTISSALAVTGTDVGPIGLLALVLLVAGIGSVLVSRRGRRVPRTK